MKKKEWKDNNGDGFITELQNWANKWSIWRKAPKSYESMPKGSKGGQKGLDKLKPNFLQHIADLLGGKTIAVLSEMNSFTNGGINFVMEIPGFTRKEIVHSYTLSSVASEFGPLAGYIPFGEIQMNYSNSLNMHWSNQLAGTTIGVSVSFGFEAGTGAKSKGKAKGGASLTTGNISLSIDAKNTAPVYWGPLDIPGYILITGGPSVTGKFVVGWKADSGGADRFFRYFGQYPPGRLALIIKNFIVGVTPSKHSDVYKKDDDGLKKVAPPEINIKIVSGAIGRYYSSESPQYAIAEFEPQAIPFEKSWGYFLYNFALGDDTVPDYIYDVMFAIENDTEPVKDEIEKHKMELAELGVEDELIFDFYVEGFASMPWVSAKNDSVPEKEKSRIVYKQGKKYNCYFI